MMQPIVSQLDKAIAKAQSAVRWTSVARVYTTPVSTVTTTSRIKRGGGCVFFGGGVACLVCFYEF
jgi:hypothetical protein